MKVKITIKIRSAGWLSSSTVYIHKVGIYLNLKLHLRSIILLRFTFLFFFFLFFPFHSLFTSFPHTIVFSLTGLWVLALVNCRLGTFAEKLINVFPHYLPFPLSLIYTHIFTHTPPHYILSLFPSFPSVFPSSLLLEFFLPQHEQIRINREKENWCEDKCNRILVSFCVVSRAWSTMYTHIYYLVVLTYYTSTTTTYC